MSLTTADEGNPKKMDLIKIPEGEIIKINGMPFEATKNTFVRGRKEN